MKQQVLKIKSKTLFVFRAKAPGRSQASADPTITIITTGTSIIFPR